MARVSAVEVEQLLDERFGEPVELPWLQYRAAPHLFARLGIEGWAVYDGLVALAAKTAGATLLTRDARAASTYARLGVTTEILPGSSKPGL